MWSLKILVVLVVGVITQSHNSESLRILGVFPLAGKSHFICGEVLMKALAEKGHSVDVISHFPQKKPVPNYVDISLSGLSDDKTNNLTFKEARFFSTLSLKYLAHEAGTLVCDLLAHDKLQELINKPKNSYDLIIVELFVSPCFLAFGKHFDVPLVGFAASKMHDWLFKPFANPFDSAYMPSLFSSFTQDMTFFERIRNTFFYYYVTYQMDYYFEYQSEHVEKYFGRKLSSIQELYDDISILLVNSHYSLNDIKPTTPDIIDIGGLHVDVSDQKLSTDLQQWLDGSKDGCIYISFGSMVRIETLPSDEMEAFYEMFKRISPVRVLMKIADPKRLPTSLPKNVKTSSWLPQVAVLRHENVKAFITHGGLLGTQESVAAGVPMVGIALFGDQHTNIQTYVRRKIAMSVDVNNITADSLTSSVNTILNDPQYQNNIKEVSKLFMDRPMSAKDTAIYWVEYAAKYGNRLKSPAKKLTWIEFYLLDVYGFVLGIILLVLFMLKKILGFIYRLFFSRKNVKKSLKSSSTSKKNK